jgi:hypothetical protein
LMQALRVFGIDPEIGEERALIADLPLWALQGGSTWRRKKPRGRSAKEVEVLRDALAALLEAARRSDIHGFADGDLADLGSLCQGAMPAGHCLVLAENSIAENHPIVAGLQQQGAIVSLARLSVGRDGAWSGLEGLITELQQETGIGIAGDALAELARRTLKSKGAFGDKQVDAESTARFAGEYRKLANLAHGRGQRRIERPQVEGSTKDRGEEDVWQILDAIGQGRGGEALARYRRLIEGAADPVAARLSFFSLVSTFCRQLAAVAGMARLERVPPSIQNFNEFKSRWAPKLQAQPREGGNNPLAGLHPFRLHKAYLAASRIRRDELARLPSRALETELQIKGEVSDPDAAMAAFIAHLVACRL